MRQEKKTLWDAIGERLTRKLEAVQAVPVVFVDRALKYGLLSLFVSFAGCYAGNRMSSLNFVCCSVAIGAYCAARALRLLRLAEKRDYDVLEGTVSGIKGKHSPGRAYVVWLRLDGGAAARLLMDKNQRLEAGRRYRFYFSKKRGFLSGIRGLDAALNTGSLYGVEELK